MSNKTKIIAVAGNPNVGKSTIFNALTGLKQHTGNWSGKTVENATGNFTHQNQKFQLVDLPGIHSLGTNSAEEQIASNYLLNDEWDAVLVVIDATSLERGINLVLQIQELTDKIIVCINLMDEAKKKSINIDIDKLKSLLGTTIITMSAGKNQGIDDLKNTLNQTTYDFGNLPQLKNSYYYIMSKLQSQKFFEEIAKEAESIYSQTVTVKPNLFGRPTKAQLFDHKLDKILTSKITGIPIMLLLLLLILWFTIAGANVPSSLLASGFNWLEIQLLQLFEFFGIPEIITSFALEGVYRTLAWVIAVMLPPMAIFFPLFALLEDFGYLPRVAFNLDNSFRKCHAHGKQALTMAMGFGCNACAIVGARIIDSPRERLIAILTNVFVPCNGRFPTLILIISMFFTAASPLAPLQSAIILLSVILLGIAATFITSNILSKTLLKGEASSFVLELPPYRRPQYAKVILRAVLDRVLFVLWRAIKIASIAGVIIWITANVTVGNTTILQHMANFLDPLGKLMGMDGVILLAFILGFPANEIVVPIMIMTYMALGGLLELGDTSQLYDLFLANGWTWLTALCTMIFVLFHFPCGTTCYTIKQETNSWKWTAVAFILPTIIGIVLCITTATMVNFFI